MKLLNIKNVLLLLGAVTKPGLVDRLHINFFKKLDLEQTQIFAIKHF